MPAPARKRSATLARPASESKPILAAVLALIGAFLLVAMLFHSAADQNLIPEWLEKTFSLPAESNVKPAQNPCGAFGATVAVILFSLFGFAGFLIPFFLCAAAWFALNQRAHTLWPVKVTLMALCVILFAPILTLWLGTAKDVSVAFDPRGPGGVLGGMLFGSVFHPVLGDYGAWILVFPYGFCLLGALADDPKATLSSWIAEMRDGLGAWNAERKAAALTAAEEQRRADALAASQRPRGAHGAAVQAAVQDLKSTLEYP
jgi:DNA segregation ATPase FtsK/SpoIIIE-like protein